MNRRIGIRMTASLVVFLVGSVAAHADRIVLVAGGGTKGDGAPATEARIQAPFGVAFDVDENLYFVEMTGQRLRKIDKKGVLTTIAGTGEKGNTGDDGPGNRATFNGMHHLAATATHDLLLADTWNNRIRRVDLKGGTVAAWAGTGTKGFRGDDGPALEAEFGGVYCLAHDGPRERLLVADLDNHRIRAIDFKNHTVTTVAGNGEKGVPADGADAVKAPLLDPRAVAVDSHGNIYILERAGHALRVVESGKIRTVVGTGKAGATGDDGEARQATLNGPKHLCIDRDDSVIIADTENHLIRRYLPTEKKIVRVAGTGTKGAAGLNGPPEKVELNQPHGVLVGPSGELFIADSSNNRILKIERTK